MGGSAARGSTLSTIPIMSGSHRLQPLLAPRSIAFIGASPRENTAGRDMLRIIRRSGFDGPVYAINPKYAEVEGYPCLASLDRLPEPVDLAVMSVANARLEETLNAAIAAGVRAAVIFASGLLDGDRDPPLSARLAAIAGAAGIPICGVNCMGYYNDDAHVWICGFPSPRQPAPGHIALIAQSGSVFGALAHNDARLKFNLVVNPGNEIVTTAADYLDYALDQPSTRVVGLFLETVRDPKGFVAALDKARRRAIPVVVLKIGRTEESQRLAVSHTGAIAGNDAAYEALFQRYGVIRVQTEDELAATLLLLGHDRRAAAGGIATIHDSGGQREMLVDLAADLSVPFARIGDATKAKLAARLEYGLEPHNPLDAWGTGNDFIGIFTDCLQALVDDPDAALAILFADVRDNYYLSDGYLEAVKTVAGRTPKPVLMATHFSGVRHDDLIRRAGEAGILVLDGTVPALLAARHALESRDAAMPVEAPPAVDLAISSRWRRRLGEARVLDEAESLALLADYGLAVVAARRVGNVEEAVAAADALGYPVALKTAMPGIHHKSDVSGVCLGVTDAGALVAAYGKMSGRLGAQAIVEPMAPAGVELSLGLIADPQFGPVIMVGAGGALIEVLGDARFGLAPFDAGTARHLIDGLKLRPVLDGVRGRPPANVSALAEAVARFSVLAAELGDLLAEADVNPLIAGPAGAIAVDALIVPRAALKETN
ncbi:MAG: CoA-binding protein [Alphaproteobacteria bacterium]|nr:CoA-binding protein [Alphaproteobacteria bacterium]